MRPGVLVLGEGAAFYAITYDARGWHRGVHESAYDSFTHLRYAGVKPYMIDPTACPPLEKPHSLLRRADLEPAGHALTQFAGMLCDSKIAERVAVRVRAPVALPGGPLACWQRVMGQVREVLWTEELPADARWLVVDGFEAVARATGATLDEALARWRRAVEEVEPLPPGSRKVVALPVPQREEPTPPEAVAPKGEYEDPDGKFKAFSLGVVTVQAPHPRACVPPRVKWPPPSGDSTPAVAIPIPPRTELPEEYRTAGFSRVARLLDGLGRVRHAFLRDDEAGGFLLVGEGVADLVDPATVEAEIAASTVAERALDAKLPQSMQRERERSNQPFAMTTYQVWDDGRQRRVPLNRSSGLYAGSWSPQALGGETAWRVVRLIRR